MSLAGEPISFASHADAIATGIDAVYQTLALADHLDPAANMFLGNELTKKVMGVTVLDIARMRTETERVLMDRLGVRLKVPGCADRKPVGRPASGSGDCQGCLPRRFARSGHGRTDGGSRTTRDCPNAQSY